MGGGTTDKLGVALVAIMNQVFQAYGQAAYDRTLDYAERVGIHNVDKIANWVDNTFSSDTDGTSSKKGKKRNRPDPKLEVRNASGLLQTSNVPNGYIQEAQTLTSSVVKLGKPVYERNYMEAFMRMMNGKGRIYVQYGHMMDFGLNKRSIHVECFRHSAGYNVSSRYDWNANYIKNGPESTDVTLQHAFGVQYSNSGAAGQPEITNFNAAVSLPFKPVNHGLNSMSAITRPILEDESFNLNKLKFDFRDLSAHVDDTNYLGSDIKFLPMVTTRTNQYRNKSELYRHNNQLNTAVNANGEIVPNFGTKGAPIQYDAVLNYGKITYKLMNKGAYPINVEFIIYKYKANSEALIQNASDSSSQIYDSIVNPIEDAYMAKKSEFYSTNFQGGRIPSKTDVTTDPRFKCLPQLARGKEYEHPWKEETRFTCCIPSGARKIQQIMLPGSVYNPLDVEQANYAGSTWTIADKMTYAVAIAASGALTTQDMHGLGYNLADGFGAVGGSAGYVGAENFIGDCYSQGQLQWLVEYEESISACIPRMPDRRDLLTFGEVIQPDGTRANGTKLFSPRAAPIIPATNVMRTTPHGVTMTFEGAAGNPVHADMGSSGMSAAPIEQNEFAQGTAPDEQGQNPSAPGGA